MIPRFTMAALLGACLCAGAARPLDISPVWSGHPVGFDLLTSGNRQFVAFYDDQRRMTVAARTLPSTEWHMVRLPSQLVWDSHNYIVITADRGGYLHLSGNMHAVPLVYFRTAKPWDIDTFEKLPMTGKEELKVTYPRFVRGASGELMYTYRDGRSGSGNQYWNKYDEAAKTWTRVTDRPLTDGQGRMNAYFVGPTSGPDGYFHMVWVWRNTPDCATNHDLTYARSKDLAAWETSDGKPLTLPIRVETGEVVDPVPPGGGIINGNTKLGFDAQKRPVITYHKHDAAGKTQIYAARLENRRWVIYQVSNWDYRWEFSGGGSINFEIRPGAVSAERDGTLLLDYTHVKFGSGTWRLDPATLKPIGQFKRTSPWPAELQKVESTFPGMTVHFTPYGKYALRWETLNANRDRPRTPPLPEPSMLKLYELAP